MSAVNQRFTSSLQVNMLQYLCPSINNVSEANVSWYIAVLTINPMCAAVLNTSTSAAGNRSVTLLCTLLHLLRLMKSSTHVVSPPPSARVLSLCAQTHM